MALHKLLPLIAFVLNISLFAIALLRNPRSRLNRLFAYFICGFAVWNLGVWMLRRAPDPAAASTAELVAHLGITALPALYYHFVLIFLDATVQKRRSLMIAYGFSGLFWILDALGSPLFLKGVTWTTWGWAPIGGPLYNVFFLFFYAFFITALVQLGKGYRRSASSFRRNRALLIWLGTVLTVSAGLIDIIRFALAKPFPVLDKLYPPGIPANMVFAVLLAIAIVRYRMFDVSMAVKKAALYFVLFGAVTLGLFALDEYVDVQAANRLWVIGPLGFFVTMLVSPLARPFEEQVERVMFSKRRGCYDTLVALSKRMSTILQFRTLIETLVQGLLRGVPLTHCVLMIYDRAEDVYVPYQDGATGDPAEIPLMRPTDALVQWFRQADGVLVKEEAKLDPDIADYFGSAEGDLEDIKATVIVPLKVEQELVGILFLGEKLSGEIFNGQELEVLSVLANQAAVALQNARLYEELGATNTRLVQANMLKSQFLASMSHELRTPLNSVIGFSKVLLKRLDGDLNERQESYVRSVYNSSTHLLQLINTILDFSRSEAGKLNLDAEDVDMHGLVDECVDTSLSLLRDKRVKLEKDVPAALPTVHADRTKVKQIILNLLSNAIKFTSEGRIAITVLVEPSQLHVTVSDTGIGIPDPEIPRLFEPFHRLDSPLAREAGGTGLGLAISKRFVELHGGKIWAESREKRGSTFHFTLPLQSSMN